MAVNQNRNSGLPGFEQFYLNLFFKLGSTLTSDEAALRSFQTSSSDMLRLCEEHDLGVLSQQQLVPRLQGIENSSRNWSVLMVLNHLSIVNKAVMDTVRSLKADSQPFVPIRIVDFKPGPDVDEYTIDRFRDRCQRYYSFAKSHQPLRTSLTFEHPWFGPLDGHRWHCLAAVHQKIHRRQIYKILAMIGVT